MAEKKGRRKQENRKGGGKLARTEPVSVRLDPRQRYLTELGARIQRRTVSSFIEWLITEGLQAIEMSQRVPRESDRRNRPALFSQTGNHSPLPLHPHELSVSSVRLMDEAHRLWDPEESDRFARLALLYPDLLNYEETILWKLIVECPAIWELDYIDENNWTLFPALETLDYQALRKYWERFKQVAAGEAEASILPTKKFYTDERGIPKQKIVDPLEDNGEG